MRSIHLLFCFSLLIFSAKAQLGGVDPTTLTSSDIKKMGFSATDLQSIKSVGAQAANVPSKLPISDTIVQEEDTLTVQSSQAGEDSLNLEQQRAERFMSTYGKSFFKERNLRVFRSASHLNAPDDYILGPGDELNIAIWGFAEVSAAERIGDDGAIHPNLVGKIYLNGLSMGDARKLMKAKFGNVYDLKNSQISIELKYSKVIKVNIVGEVNKPGTYSVSAMNSAFNVLCLAGGITDLGSVRNIVIKRDNKLIRVLDVYKFLLDPTFSGDFFLKNNDYIIVQAAEKIVFVKGEVGRDGKYELLKNEGLSDLIKYAGNLKSFAFREEAHVVRVDTNHLVIKDLDLKSALAGKLVLLKSGDTVLISSIDGIVRDFVEVEGALQLTGKFQYLKGEKLSHLMKRAQGLRFDAYKGRAYIIRTYSGGAKKYFQININDLERDSNSVSNLVLEELDRFKVFSVHDFHDEYTVEIRGAVRHPVTIEYSDNLTLQDLIFFAGGMLNQASNKRIEISRMINFSEVKDSDAPSEFIVETFEVSDDMELNAKQEIKLRPYDKVFVRFIEDFRFHQLVILKGEFKYPGTYALLHDKETIREVVERAGGLNEGAFLRGAKMVRKDEGRGELVVDFEALFKKNKEQYNYVLREGDSLIIPKVDDIITIRGEVGSSLVAGRIIQNSPFTNRKRAKYYIKEYAGGFTKNADRSKVYVITSSGGVKKSKNFGLFKVYPRVKRGDRIVVEAKLVKAATEKTPTDWNQIVENLTVKVTGLLTLYLLTKNVFK